MKTIPLTMGKSALVDDEDFENLSKYMWRASWSPYTKTFYARRAVPTSLRKGKQGSIHMHREILGLNTGDGVLVDHINRDTLDNRKENLRKATRAQNKMNSIRPRHNTSGFKGVHCVRGKWIARITISKKKTYLGAYDTPEKAHEAYCLAAEEHFGEFARTA